MGRGGMKYLQECSPKGTQKVPRRSVPRCIPRCIPWSVTRSVAKSVPQSQSVPRWWGVKDHEACRSHWSRMISFGPSTLCIISPATCLVWCYKLLQRAVQALLVWQTRWSAQIGNYDESLFKRPRFSQSWVGGTPPDWVEHIYVNRGSLIYFNFYQYLKTFYLFSAESISIHLWRFSFRSLRPGFLSPSQGLLAPTTRSH